MSGHRIGSFELTATRSRARGKDKDDLLLLAALNEENPVDLLDALEEHILDVDHYSGSDGTMQIRPQARQRVDDVLEITFSVDISGVQEIIRDGTLDGMPIKAVKGKDDVARLFSCCALWRPPSGDRGILLVHSPWGRGGSKTVILRLLQRAVNKVVEAKAKLHADPLIPSSAVDRLLRNADATKIVYSRNTGIRSTFGNKSTTHSASAEMDLVIKGSDSRPYRDALRSALRSTGDREQFYTVRLRDGLDGDGYHEETFDEVEVVFADAAGSTKYSMSSNTIPRVSHELTNQINGVYYGLADEDEADWARQLMEGVSPHLHRLIESISRSM